VRFGTLIIVLSVPALFIALAKLFGTYTADAEADRPMLPDEDRRNTERPGTILDV